MRLSIVVVVPARLLDRSTVDRRPTGCGTACDHSGRIVCCGVLGRREPNGTRRTTRHEVVATARITQHQTDGIAPSRTHLHRTLNPRVGAGQAILDAPSPLWANGSP